MRRLGNAILRLLACIVSALVVVECQHESYCSPIKNDFINFTHSDQTDNQLKQTIEYFSDELPIVILDYNELNDSADLSESIKASFGPGALGILFVKNVPDLASKRSNLLQISRKLAHLDDATKSSLEDAHSLYSIGYSHGKEMLRKNKADLSKISFYGNPISNDVTNGNQSLIDNYRSVYGRNIWPTQKLPDLEASFMSLGTLVHSVGQLIAHQLDEYVMEQRDGYKNGLFQEVIGTNVPKARLLYYLSPNEMEENDMEMSDDWCGWHNDHSALTGLVLGMFFDANGRIIEEIENYKSGNTNSEDANSGGLFVKTRNGITHRIALNEEESSKYLAFQIGETSQILSAGALVATPHAVVGYKDKKDVSRASFAVFHQPHYYMPMAAPYHDGIDLETVQFDRFLPENVPTLSSRWVNESGDTFGKFTTRTFEKYYDMKMEK